jgi:hypothetical protein
MHVQEENKRKKRKTIEKETKQKKQS